MKSANYSLIQFLGDAARGEALNVGVVVWDGMSFELAIDHDAVSRVVRENPKLHRDSLFSIEPILQERLTENRQRERTVAEFIGEQRGYPVLFSEPRHTTLLDDSAGLSKAAERLVLRIVQPSRRGGGGGGGDIGELAERALREAVASRRVSRDYTFNRSKTGLIRRVDYFVDSGKNIALDVIKLNLKRADDIRLRADAEAYKIIDITAANDLSAFVVLTEFSRDPTLASVNEGAQRIIHSVGASIETDTKAAIARLDD